MISWKCFIKGPSHCFFARLFRWGVKVSEVNRCHILINFSSTHPQNFLKKSFVKLNKLYYLVTQLYSAFSSVNLQQLLHCVC